MSDCARDTADKLIGKALPKCIEHAGFAAEIMVEGSFGDTGAFGNVINSRGVHALFHKPGASRFDERATPALGPPRRTGRTGRAKAPLEDAAAGTMSFFRPVRSEERRVGQAVVSQCKSRWSPVP